MWQFLCMFYKTDVIMQVQKLFRCKGKIKCALRQNKQVTFNEKKHSMTLCFEKSSKPSTSLFLKKIICAKLFNL